MKWYLLCMCMYIYIYTHTIYAYMLCRIMYVASICKYVLLTVGHCEYWCVYIAIFIFEEYSVIIESMRVSNRPMWPRTGRLFYPRQKLILFSGFKHSNANGLTQHQTYIYIYTLYNIYIYTLYIINICIHIYTYICIRPGI